MKRSLLMLAGLLASGLTQAQHAAPAIGRLFTTPAERAQLDAQRSGVPDPAPAIAAPPEPADADAPPQLVTLNGVVRRSSGKSTIWLNNVPQNDGQNQFVAGQARQPNAAATLALRDANGKQVVIKAGQSYQLENGTVTEDYGR